MANFLVNSAIMTLWVRMVGQRKCPMSIRARVALVMGAAVRHATFISVSLQGDRVRCGTGPLLRRRCASLTRHATAVPGPARFGQVLEVLKEGARSKNHRLRRRCAGVLGELLFYVSTQDPADAAAASGHAGEAERMWTMPGWAVPMLTKALGSSDTVKRHYAAKTLENVLAQSAVFGPKFATQVRRRALASRPVWRACGWLTPSGSSLDGRRCRKLVARCWTWPSTAASTRCAAPRPRR